MSQHHSAVGMTDPSSSAAPSDDPSVEILHGLRDAGVGLVALSANNEISFVNNAFLAAFDLPETECAAVLGKSFQDVCPTCPLPSSTLRRTGDETGTADAASDRTAKIIWSSNSAGGWIGVVTAPPSQAARPALLFEPDELTGLGTRKHLKACFERMSEDADRRDQRIVALFVDLDHFKQVNDTLGHAVGDGLLCKVAERLKKTVRRDDLVARVGGDEFAILVSDRALPAAEDVAGRIIKMISRPFLIDGHQITIGASVGLAARLPNENDPDKMLQRADIALYESKRGGRNQFNWFKDEMFAELEKRREIEIDLRKAVLLDQFKIVFQPQMSFEQQKVSGFEALIRWDHPVRGEVAPLDFLSVAEETGLIVEIGTWVLAEACKTAVTWPEDIAVAVNVSSIQFEDDGFLTAVGSALEKSGLSPHRLELEITETTLLKNDSVVLERMNDLRALGVRISLDDFGIGYSSLNYLRKYPFDKVKIDQSFVREPFADENAHHIVEAVAQLGTAFGMNVLAEGVETVEQLARIRQNGCAAIQGYLIGRPIKPAEIGSFLEVPLPELASLQSPPKEGSTS
ncbi:putative bifunctional diguanylate cyclase/phosphodiesterase [Roseobacter sinensis]|uniref:EAL domain-containing protein n=1 Tax=Roseobacter sinensis TaxID=2931391 RepID=A0ABT3BE40_9RHOB|nr:EAL domain-containing protein [Roseobacter sp. WL0113]MCV3271834.1 EAL domain-containing protein [Roseobacter sp. WL0113]